MDEDDDDCEETTDDDDDSTGDDDDSTGDDDTASDDDTSDDDPGTLACDCENNHAPTRGTLPASLAISMLLACLAVARFRNR